MAMARPEVILVAGLALACLLDLSVALRDEFTDDNETPPDPFVSEKSELFRFSRSAAKGGLFAKYEQRQQQMKEAAEREHQHQVSGNLEEQQTPVQQQQAQVDVSRASVAAEMPNFGLQQQQQIVASQVPETESFPMSPAPAPSPVYKTVSIPKSIPFAYTYIQPAPLSKSGWSRTVTYKTSSALKAPARIQEIHTVPLSEAVHYANYMVVPSAKTERMEESSSSQKSSSSQVSSSRRESEAVHVSQHESAPILVEQVQPVLHRLVMERPVASVLLTKTSTSMVQQPNQASSVKSSSSSSSSRSHSSRMIEAGAGAPGSVVVEHHVQSAPIMGVKQVGQLVAPASVELSGPSDNGGHLKEEHFHSESRSSREESHGGEGALVSSSSSSSSSSSRSSSSRSSKMVSGSMTPTAALLAPPAPATVALVRHTFAPPLVSVKTARLVEVPSSVEARSGSNSFSSVDVDHHYSGPNVKYGYSIKQHQQQLEPARGMLVGERVVYLK